MSSKQKKKLSKSELFYIKEKEYKNIEELKKDIIEYIEYYNNRRIKSKLKGMSPIQYRQHSMLVAKFILYNFLGSVHYLAPAFYSFQFKVF